MVSPVEIDETADGAAEPKGFDSAENDAVRSDFHDFADPAVQRDDGFFKDGRSCFQGGPVPDIEALGHIEGAGETV